MCCIFGTTPDMSGNLFSIVRNTGCNCGSSTAFHVAYSNCPVLWLLFVSAYEVLLVKVAVCANIASIP
jgi:hypothetical protein